MKIVGENSFSSMLLACLLVLIFIAGIALRKKPIPLTTNTPTVNSSR
jgi:hypothetical protein